MPQPIFRVPGYDYACPPTTTELSVIRLSMVALAMVCAGASAGAQQSPIPAPPKTVHPLPQPTTVCRGCSDAGDSTKAPGGSYDERKAGTVRPSVRPSVQVTKPKVAKKPKAKVHKKRKVIAKKSPPKATSKTVSKTKPMIPFKDRPAIGDPIMMPKKDTAKK
jgi:hypothetical protein